MMVLTLPRILGTAWASVEQAGHAARPRLVRRRRARGRRPAASRSSRSSSRSWPSRCILVRLVRKIVGSHLAAHPRPSGPPRAGRPGRRRPGRRPGLGLVAAPRHLPPDPALRGRHAGAGRAGAARRPALRADPARRGPAGSWSPAGPTATRGPPAHTRSSRSCWSPATAARPAPRAEAWRPRPTAVPPHRSGRGHRRQHGAAAQPWVFPFNKPLAPEAGDNQAMAVNTTDNTVRYDVAFALVWVEDDSPALNTQRGLRLRQLHRLRGGRRSASRSSW